MIPSTGTQAAATGHGDFRAAFPALRRIIWLDTPAAPPAAAPVAAALQKAVADWSSGEFDWPAWDNAIDDARQRFACLLSVQPETVAGVGSLAEAASAVANSLPPGRVVLGENEFRSNLLPWQDRHEVVPVPSRDGVTRTEDLIAALDERCDLLVVSEVTTWAGERLDLPALRAATDAVGARLFVNLTQSCGVLPHDPAVVRADYLAVHGYKWMLCPRGAAWLVARPDRVEQLRPLSPNWHSTGVPRGYFGAAALAPDASRCDSSPAWFSWVGAVAALELLTTLDPRAVEQHCLHLAQLLVEGAADLGLTPCGSGSQIVAVRVDDPARVAHTLARRGIRASTHGDRVRFGVHYFTNDDDIHAVLNALRAAAVGPP
ncbi:aminotransferase class V-fold PLP-dependent enzyme [Cryptosporangium minutisporangium]|uniref:Aminotransferase class V-fold PLP-dependent enzyme n=1 Tax=Cryptosporangium minutisporangium TaxID=113569 RepID=A0ABP6SZB5_9ACTN